jgi:hypothetical protein
MINRSPSQWIHLRFATVNLYHPTYRLMAGILGKTYRLMATGTHTPAAHNTGPIHQNRQPSHGVSFRITPFNTPMTSVFIK